MIEKVLTQHNTVMKRKALIYALISLYKKDNAIYPVHKAYGALGGSVNGKFIKYNCNTDTFMRIR